eukprot:jgi/Botrbrau1/1583/Bobra.0185s0006.2
MITGGISIGVYRFGFKGYFQRLQNFNVSIWTSVASLTKIRHSWRGQVDMQEDHRVPNPLFHDGLAQEVLSGAELQPSRSYAALLSTEFMTTAHMSDMRFDRAQHYLGEKQMVAGGHEQGMNCWFEDGLNSYNQHQDSADEQSTTVHHCQGSSTMDFSTGILEASMHHNSTGMDCRPDFTHSYQNMSAGDEVEVPTDPTNVESWLRWMEQRQYFDRNYQPLLADQEVASLSRVEPQLQLPTGHIERPPTLNALRYDGREHTDERGIEHNSCVLSIEAAEFLELED